MMQNNSEAEKQEEMMEAEDTGETDGQSSGQRGLQAQVVIRQVHVRVLPSFHAVVKG